MFDRKCKCGETQSSLLDMVVETGGKIISAKDARANSVTTQDDKKIDQLKFVLEKIEYKSKNGFTNYHYKGFPLYEEVVVGLHKLGYTVCFPSRREGFMNGGDSAPTRNVIRWD